MAGRFVGAKQGTGKTRMALGYIMHGSKKGPVLIVCNLTNVDGWLQEVMQIIRRVPKGGLRIFAPSLGGDVFPLSLRQNVLLLLLSLLPLLPR
jgi:hypothetical protein